jgi:hypothetical protein
MRGGPVSEASNGNDAYNGGAVSAGSYSAGSGIGISTNVISVSGGNILSAARHGLKLRSVADSIKEIGQIGELETWASGTLSIAADTTDAVYTGSTAAIATLDNIRALQTLFGATTAIGICVWNKGTGTVTVSDSGATINGAASMDIAAGNYACLMMSSSTTWLAMRGAMAPSALTTPYAYEPFSELMIESSGAIASDGTLTGGTYNGTRMFRFCCPGSFTATGMRMLFRTVTSSLNFRYGLYNSSKTLIASTPRFTAAVSIVETDFSVPVSLAGGAEYYMGYYDGDSTGNITFGLVSGKSVSPSDPILQLSDSSELPSIIGSGYTQTQYRPWMALVAN